MDKKGVLKGLEQDVAQEGKLFKLYKNFESVGAEIKDSWFKSSDAFRKDGKQFLFNIAAGNNKEGLLNQTYGLFLLTLLVDRFNVEFKESEKEKYRRSLVSLMDYVEENGVDVSPFSTPKTNKELFNGLGGRKFIESLTWTLSCLLYARRLHRARKVRLDAEMNRIIRLTSVLLQALMDSVIRANGEVGYEPVNESGEEFNDYIGWGPITGCRERSLYFTHSVCETFGDLEDTVLGNPELRIDEDTEFVNSLAEISRYNIVEKFKKVCEIVGANVYNSYKHQIGKEFFYADGTPANFKQISYTLQSPVLLNQLYVVLCAIFTNYHKTMAQDSDAWKIFSTNIKNAVDNVYKAYRDLQDVGKENLVNREYVTFSESHIDDDYYKKYHSYLAGERINVAVLETLIIRTKSMIVTYVTKYPEKEIGEILNIMLMNRKTNNNGEPEWLWSKIGFDLQQTERAVSAIREFYDYYENYEREYAEKNADIEELKREYEDKYKSLNFLYDSRLEEIRNHFKSEAVQAKEKFQLKLDEAKNSNEVEKAVRNVVSNTVTEHISKSLSEIFEKIANSNMENNAGGDRSSFLNLEERKMRDSLVQMIKSFLVPLAQEANLNQQDDLSGDRKAKDWTAEKIVNLFLADVQKFALNWMEVLCRKNEPHENYGSKDVKGSITENIDLG